MEWLPIRPKCRMKLGVLQNLLTNHTPEIRPTGYTLERIKLTKIIFVIIFAKSHLTRLHLLLLLIEAPNDVSLLNRRHGHVDDIYVINIHHFVFLVSIIKLKIGVSPPF